MIYNTGEVLAHPCESLYSRIRRFYISNRGCKVEWERIARNVSNVKRKNEKEKRNINNPFVYWPLAYIDQNSSTESDLIDDSPIKQLRGYFPKKHCPICAGIYFHSDVFDKPWLEKCPIHNVELTAYCPTCNMIWPTAARLRYVSCNTCGTLVKSEEQFDFEFLTQRKKVDELYDHVKFLKKTIPQFIPITYMRGHCYFEQINLESRFLISVLKTTECLPNSLTAYFSENIVSSKVEQLDFNYEQLDYGFRSKSGPSSEVIEEVRATLSNVLGRKHKLGKCRSEYTECIACKAWYLWCVSVSNPNAFKREYDFLIWGRVFRSIFNFDCPAIVKRPREVITNNESFLCPDEEKSLLNNAVCKRVFDLRSIDALAYIYQWLSEDKQLTRFFKQKKPYSIHQPRKCYRYGNKRYPKIPIYLYYLNGRYTLASPKFSLIQYLHDSEELLLKWYGGNRIT
jgi:hypothetical protein